MADAFSSGTPSLILLIGVLGVLVLILLVLGAISRSLLRVERRLAEQSTQAMRESAPIPSAAASPAPTAAEMKKMTRESDFMTFLAEDKARKVLPKREQFAAYRKWRNEKGLNWPHGPEITEQ